MADAGEAYQESDYITDFTLPSRRFVSARLKNCHFEIIYDRGGIGVSRHRLTVNSLGGKWIAGEDRVFRPISGAY